MKVEIESTKIVKPSYEDGVEVPPTDVHVELSHFDAITYNIHIAILYAYRPPTPPNSQIEKGLAKAISVYREWAGRLTTNPEGKRSILLNDKGVKFVEASVDSSLDKAISFSRPSAEFLSLHPTLEGVEELLQCQLTRFTCGSLVVGFTSHHAVADGTSTSNFLVQWGKACRGLSMGPPPLCNRVAVFPPRDPLCYDKFEHRGVEFVKRTNQYETEEEDQHDDDDHHSSDAGIIIHKAHFTTDFLANLKAKASVGRSRPFSTFETLQAHLWRTMTRARDINSEEKTQIRISVNGRQRLQPRLPNDFFGNAVLWAFPRTTVKQLMNSPLQFAANLIHEEVAKLSGDYFQSFIDFASSDVLEKEGLGTSAVLCKSVLCPNIEVDSWLRLPFYELDFGGGSPFVFMPTYCPIEGMIFLLPSFMGDGSIDAFVPIFRKDLKAFKNSCYSMD